MGGGEGLEGWLKVRGEDEACHLYCYYDIVIAHPLTAVLSVRFFAFATSRTIYSLDYKRAITKHNINCFMSRRVRARL